MTLDPMQVGAVLNQRSGARMLEAVKEGLRGASEARIAVAFTRCSGLQLLLDPLRELIARGGDARVLTSTYQAVTQPEALQTLLRTEGLQTRLQRGPVGFHVKFWWFKRGEGVTCWAGSSNLTKGGLTSNLEWNLRREDADAAELTRSQFDSLWTRPDVAPLSAAEIARYAAEHREAQLRAVEVVQEGGAPGVVANPAQVEALARLAALRAQGHRRAAIIVATGVGKTYLAAMDARAAGARRVLYVSHRMEHLWQAQGSFRRVWGADLRSGLLGDGVAELDRDHLFATVQSLRRRTELLDRPWDYLIIDEFHHAEAGSYAPLRGLRDRAFLLGLTATPERMDGRDVLEWCDHTVAYELRLPEAIERGLLLPFHYFSAADRALDAHGLPWRGLEDEEARLCVEERVDLILRHALDRGFDGPRRATVAFCAGVRHARYMAEALQRRGHVADVALGEHRPEARRALYDRLADPADPLEWLFVSDVLNEGVDVPGINSVLFLRPTESVTLFLQQLGRGLRKAPGVDVLTVIDFVGHHQQAWVGLNALDSPGGAGRRVEVAEGQFVRPPVDCEIVLEDRTREILDKVKRHATRKAQAEAVYKELRADGAGRRPLPADLWDRPDLSEPRELVRVHQDWLGLQVACGDAPPWADALPAPALRLLRAAERDWQRPRVTEYALLWGLCAQPDDPFAGYAAFFERFPAWAPERVDPAEAARGKPGQKLAEVLGEALASVDPLRLHPEVRGVLGPALLPEVEGRLGLTLQKDLRDRHGGVLRRPEDLRRFQAYTRPEVVQHFGVQYDPARHNAGVLEIGDRTALICKIDTSTAAAAHQYQNTLLDRETFAWTSQNKMSPENTAGRRLLAAAQEADRVHLFVQPAAHAPARYLGPVRALAVEGASPMRVTLRLTEPVPADIADELGGPGAEPSGADEA